MIINPFPWSMDQHALPMEPTILFTGGREGYHNIPQMISVFTYLVDRYEPFRVVHGDCRGVDKQIALIGQRMNQDVIPYPAKWGNGLSVGTD
jgi:hypothetical protein